MSRDRWRIRRVGRSSPMGLRSAGGLSLIEVLVAIGVLAAVAGGAIAVVGQNTRFLSQAEQRVLAAILCDNLAAEAMARAAPLTRGAETGEISFAGQNWAFDRTVSEAGVEGLVRISIDVRAQGGGATLASVVTLKAESFPDARAPQ